MDPDALTRVAAAREEYTAGGLAEDDLLPDPVAMFRRWYDDAHAAGLHEPNAMVVATVSADFAPSARLVLLKGVSEDGFVFYTNTGSRKGTELAGNPRCALLFPWHPLERQVRVDGTAVPLPRAAVDDYFAVRPRGSQLGAWASPQSQVLPDRAAVEAGLAAAVERFGAEGPIPPPPHWGGLRVVPETVEFWQGDQERRHTRLVHLREDAGRRRQLLWP